MPLEEPSWWYSEATDARARLLAPLGRLYGWIGERRYRGTEAYRSRYPVICVGNFTAGGTGKTPLAILIAQLLKERGISPVFLTRGYGGAVPGPAWVDDGAAAAHRFGDEPVLLARVAPTLVARDRKAGVLMLEAGGQKLGAVIMDDGLQNPTLAKDLTIAVVDGKRGFGNGEVIPAGPLRASMEFQLGLVDAIVVREADPRENDGEGVHALLKRRFPGPVLEARTRPAGDTAWLAGQPVVAFAGIANPARFYSLLEGLGARLVARVSFADHHVFTREDAAKLLELAQSTGARLVTTEKDLARLEGGNRVSAALVRAVRALPIALAFEARDLGRLATLVEAATQPQHGLRRDESPQP